MVWNEIVYCHIYCFLFSFSSIVTLLFDYLILFFIVIFLFDYLILFFVVYIAVWLSSSLFHCLPCCLIIIFFFHCLHCCLTKNLQAMKWSSTCHRTWTARISSSRYSVHPTHHWILPSMNPMIRSNVSYPRTTSSLRPWIHHSHTRSLRNKNCTSDRGEGERILNSRRRGSEYWIVTGLGDVRHN